jgi:hypothetical protein
MSLTTDQIRELIKSHFTPETWASMTKARKIALKIQSLGLKAIARLFGVDGTPVDNRAVHLTLGRAIWGEKWTEFSAPPQQSEGAVEPCRTSDTAVSGRNGVSQRDTNSEQPVAF